MKKITLILLAFITVTAVSAQIEITTSDAGIGLSQSVPGSEVFGVLAPCSQGQDGFDINGAAGSNVNNGFVSAVDIIIPAGEFFTLESVSNVNMLTFAGFLPTTATVIYFEDAGNGFPSNTEIGSESGIALTINSSAPWVNPAADVHNVDFDVTPITFNGGATETKVWIGIQFDNDDPAQSATFFEIRNDDTGGGDAALVGEPLVQRNPNTMLWNYVDFGTGNGAEINSEGFYTLNGECDVLSVNENVLAQISLYPNPSSDILNINVPASVEITNVTMFDLLGKNTGVVLSNGSIDISNLNKGIYLLSIETSQGTLTQKVVKK
jgi:hypothetical protein